VATTLATWPFPSVPVEQARDDLDVMGVPA